VNPTGSMADALRQWAARTPDALAFSFLIDGEDEGPRLTYGALDREARAIATALQDVAGPGDRALLLYAPGLAFVSAFFGCQYAGVVPVPAYPPRPDRLALSWETLTTLAADCRPTVILTDRAVAPFVPARPAVADVPRIVTDALDLSAAGRWHEPPFNPDGLAVLQYTSGSTADPKGVMVTHRSLMHNQAMIQRTFEHVGPGGGVCWLPPYHDMGLIGGLLQIVYHGAWGRLMSPIAFLQDPGRWLRAISRFRAGTSGGPNFAYDWCVQRVAPEQTVGLDLSSWNVAAIGSEPINPATMEKFAAAFRPCGFRPEAFVPCYGLAEATLLVTSEAKAAPPVIHSVSAAELEAGRAVPAGPGEPARALVGCGHAWSGQEVCIVDPDTLTRCPDGRIGEIWVRGPSVAAGYWSRPEETERTFQARLADTGDGPYLRTGDLGFVLAGELFVTGRIKDVIIVRGRNHYPQDVEETVQTVHPGLRPGCGAVFEETRDGRPGVVVVQEVDRRHRPIDVRALVADIRQAVAERHDLQVHDVQLLEPGSIPKTSSGKVRRHACRLGYAEARLRIWKERA
jgi:acyl-CoA synthetase (AMP-forming)/AMP-acid ligase II